MSIDKTYLEWYPKANQIFKLGFGAMDELICAETTLDPNGSPTVQLHELTVERPETWTNISSKVTVSNIAVVDDDTNDMENGAVQFRLAQDIDGDPAPGDIYSFYCQAPRADDSNLEVATRVWVRIMP